MPTALIIGSGAGAAGAALALSLRENLSITVIDIGRKLEADREPLIAALASGSRYEWEDLTTRVTSRMSSASPSSRVPQKRVFGSDYPFHNVGQLDGLTVVTGAQASVISAAYGDFSNVWGSQILPFTAAAFDTWPVNAATMRRHYQAILRQIPFAGEEDDLAASFPLIGQPAPLPAMSPRSLRVLSAYDRHRSTLNDRGITIGKARLAFDAGKCSRCGLCMTGCPYGLIYSASQTFDTLRSAGRVSFHGGLLALEISERADHVAILTRELDTGRTRQFEAEHVYVACGAIGTTRLVANSLRLFDIDLPMLESRRFVVPLLSLRATEDPRQQRDFTLNQFNMTVAPGGGSVDLATLHFYTFNPAFVDALPSALRARSAEWLQAQLLRRLTVAFGYLPSWRSARLRIHIGSRSSHRALPDLQVSSDTPPSGQGQMLRTVLRRLAQSARMLDLYPLMPMVRLSPAGTSYHWGGSFPHSTDRTTSLSSDTLGRVGPWQRTHLVDAAVFPAVPAMTFGLTVMANAHRIASESMELM